jgi:hypothetical protein
MVLLSFWLYYELQGNRLFKEGKFELAKAKYEKVLREFNHVNPQDEDEGKIFGDTRVSSIFSLRL